MLAASFLESIAFNELRNLDFPSEFVLQRLVQRLLQRTLKRLDYLFEIFDSFVALFQFERCVALSKRLGVEFYLQLLISVNNFLQFFLQSCDLLVQTDFRLQVCFRRIGF